MNPLFRLFAHIGQNYSGTIDTEAGRLGGIPNFVLGFSVFMSANALLQAIGDIVLEIAILGEFVAFKIPFRFEFLFLTLLSALIAWLTLQGMKEGDLDLTQSTMTIGLTVESALILGDIFLLFTTEYDVLTTLLVRLPFMVLTSSNIAILSYILIRRMKVRRSRPNYQF
jgi:hypothetical protein